jgi:UDP-N-acetylmuramoylalanine--D-glutamate ligase
MGTDYAGKRVLVIGLGVTGLAAGQFLAGRGAKVFAQDDAEPAKLGDRLARARRFAQEVRAGGEGWDDPRGFDLVVPSPGIEPYGGTLRAALDAGIPVWSEIELAFRELAIPLVAVTGSNGKSTTTTLIGEMLRADGRKAFVGGNLGTPLIECAQDPRDAEVAVAEVSSFQLEHVERFQPRVALLLNLCEDHLDRYRSFEEYAAAKARIFERQGPRDVLIHNAEDPHVATLAARALSRRLPFSNRRALAEGIFQRNGRVIHREDGKEEHYSLDAMRIAGAHNIENLMAAILAARQVGVSPGAIREAIASFRGLPHRLAHVRDVDGVSYFDDSKGTNVGAAVRSVGSFTRPVILIAGGKDKGGDYGPLREAAARACKAVVLIGEAAPRIEKALGGVTRASRADSMADAVARAHAEASPGDVVLLSPACSSFDMFSSYAERGEIFERLVRAL